MVKVTDKQLAEIVVRALLAIVAGIRKRYDLPNSKNIVIEIGENDNIAGVITNPVNE